MSFNVYIDEEDVGNYTSNMGGYFAWALGHTEETDNSRCDSRDAMLGDRRKDGLIVLDEMKASEALVILNQALERTTCAQVIFLKRFNSPNNWGTWERAFQFLMEIRDACQECPEGKLQVSW